MSHIAINISKLSIPDKIVKIQAILGKSTNNPSVPGNADEVADLAAALAALISANGAYEAARQTCKQMMANRETALATAVAKVGALASITELVTEGNAAFILSAGFDVRAEPTPVPELSAPINVRAETNGTPGHTYVSCNPLTDAKGYLVQKCPDPLTEAGWVTVAAPTKASCDTNGVQPGMKTWYRMCGVNARGQGPWSEPALRPVM